MYNDKMFEYVAFKNLTRNQSVGELVVLKKKFGPVPITQSSV